MLSQSLPKKVCCLCFRTLECTELDCVAYELSFSFERWRLWYMCFTQKLQTDFSCILQQIQQVISRLGASYRKPSTSQYSLSFLVELMLSDVLTDIPASPCSPLYPLSPLGPVRTNTIRHLWHLQHIQHKKLSLGAKNLPGWPGRPAGPIGPEEVNKETSVTHWSWHNIGDVNIVATDLIMLGCKNIQNVDDIIRVFKGQTW